MQRPGESSIPSVLKQMVAYLSELGLSEPLFRQPANTKELQDLRYNLNKGGRVDYEAKPRPELVAGLFKLYLRELPEPLLTFPLYSAFLAASEESDEKKRTALLSELMGQLPKPNRLLVELIIKFLARLCLHVDANHVSPIFLAHIFTHIFLRPKFETIETMVQLPKAINLMQLLIETDPELLFPRVAPPTAAQTLSASSGTTTTTASRTAAAAPNSPPVSRPVGSPRTTDGGEGAQSGLRSGASAAKSPRADKSAASAASPREVLSPTLAPPARPQSPTVAPASLQSSSPEPVAPASALSPRLAALASPRSAVSSPREGIDSSSPASPEIDNKVAHLKATVQEALQTLRKDLDELEEDLMNATSADKVIDIARLVRATKKALDGRESDS